MSNQTDAVQLIVVAVMREDGDGGIQPHWTLEGGTAELFDGDFLLVADRDVTEDGHAELFTAIDEGDIERLTAERDALQLLLNERDEQLHTLELSRRAHLDGGLAAEQRAEDIDALLLAWYEANAKGLIHVTDDAYHIVTATAEVLEGKPSSVCTWNGDDSGTWHSACGVSWTFHDDGPIENGMNFCHACGDCIAVEEPAEDVALNATESGASE